ncbi:hypothetical protein PR202_gb16685 [Eleusine coracana subsp. coracana]|uniref:Uncharacterized protein n=1 Tax=Eleusine coracana subsp. coracana TaxID=191504 RepID=A0AAV5F2R4_ELECO|nr:hypothetical protein PR202_gb16685 [Eleusine coracana subsp. coracana]
MMEEGRHQICHGGGAALDLTRKGGEGEDTIQRGGARYGGPIVASARGPSTRALLQICRCAARCPDLPGVPEEEAGHRRPARRRRAGRRRPTCRIKVVASDLASGGQHHPQFDVFDNDIGLGRPVAVGSGAKNKVDRRALVYESHEGGIGLTLIIVVLALYGMTVDYSLAKLSLADVAAATGGFSPYNIIDDGCFVFVYYAVLSPTVPLATASSTPS